MEANDLFITVIGIGIGVLIGLAPYITQQTNEVVEEDYEVMAFNPDIEIVTYVQPETQRINLDEQLIEQMIFTLTNEWRAENRKQPLKWRDNTADIARAWSERMLEEGFFEHNIRQARDLGFGENIAMTPLATNVIGCGNTLSNKAMADCFMTGWINSPGHNENLLYRRYTRIGVGVSCDTQRCYATQNFKS